MMILYTCITDDDIPLPPPSSTSLVFIILSVVCLRIVSPPLFFFAQQDDMIVHVMRDFFLFRFFFLFPEVCETGDTVICDDSICLLSFA